MQVYIWDLLPTNVRSTGAGLTYNGGTWLAAWAAIVTTLMAGASTKPQPWLPSITINMAIGAILMIISFVLAVTVLKQTKKR
jgi:glucan phosphoethanolaminetransferase (alkaline phosphatase superfamily)